MMVKLEAGKCYRTRDGRKVGPMRACGTSGAFFSSEGTMWYSNGEFYPNMPSEHDIVAEWVDNDPIERTKYMIEVMQAYVDGKQVEHSLTGDTWHILRTPYWDWQGLSYRIAETPDSINWDHVSPEFKYMARDENGDVVLFTNKPTLSERIWRCDKGSYCCATSHASYTRGTFDWKNSLVTRPGVEA